MKDGLSNSRIIHVQSLTVCPYAQALYARANARTPTWGGEV